jgi:hypothetical protein
MRSGFSEKTDAIVLPMAVNATHPDYDASALDWSRARDVLSGEDAVKAAGEKYLPRLDSQTDEEFVLSGRGPPLAQMSVAKRFALRPSRLVV